MTMVAPSLAERVDGLDWPVIATELDGLGCATAGCVRLATTYGSAAVRRACIGIFRFETCS